MLLAELCESIQLTLLGLSPENWGTLKVGSDPDQIPIELCLDPDQIVNSTKRTIFILPVLLRPIVKDSGGRGRGKKQVLYELLVASVLVIPFSTFRKGDVAEWDEVKTVLNLREELESHIMGTDFKNSTFNVGYTLLNCEPEEAVEIELNSRNFVANTDYTFEITRCVG